MQTTRTRREFLASASRAAGMAVGAATGLRCFQAPAADDGADADRIWDVVVCGGGPSGVMAAWAAALDGAACLLVERQPVLGGMATSGLVGPMSKFRFRLENVDTDAITVWMAQDRTRYSQPQLREALQKAVADRRIALFGGPWAVFGSTIRPGSVSVNATRYSGAACDPGVLARAKAAMSADIPVMIDVFRQAHPAFAKCSLRDVAAVVGVRETRGAVGEYCLTAEDVRGGRIFDDAVALGGHPLDMHRSKDASQEAPFLDRPYSIPYRCLVPKGSQNLLVCGGLISADRQAFSSARVQAQCMATGQAAGTAAALCAAGAVVPSNLDFRQFRQRLVAQGAVLCPSAKTGATF